MEPLTFFCLQRLFEHFLPVILSPSECAWLMCTEFRKHSSFFKKYTLPVCMAKKKLACSLLSFSLHFTSWKFWKWDCYLVLLRLSVAGGRNTYKLFGVQNKCVCRVTAVCRDGTGLDTNKSRVSNCITAVIIIIFTDLSVSLPISLLSLISLVKRVFWVFCRCFNKLPQP